MEIDMSALLFKTIYHHANAKVILSFTRLRS